jgi:hypothetical protein
MFKLTSNFSGSWRSKCQKKFMKKSDRQEKKICLWILNCFWIFTNYWARLQEIFWKLMHRIQHYNSAVLFFIFMLSFTGKLQFYRVMGKILCNKFCHSLFKIVGVGGKFTLVIFFIWRFASSSFCQIKRSLRFSFLLSLLDFFYIFKKLVIFSMLKKTSINTSCG